MPNVSLSRVHSIFNLIVQAVSAFSLTCLQGELDTGSLIQRGPGVKLRPEAADGMIMKHLDASESCKRR